jgi:hypothetical protein
MVFLIVTILDRQDIDGWILHPYPEFSQDVLRI